MAASRTRRRTRRGKCRWRTWRRRTWRRRKWRTATATVAATGADVPATDDVTTKRPLSHCLAHSSTRHSHVGGATEPRAPTTLAQATRALASLANSGAARALIAPSLREGPSPHTTRIASASNTICAALSCDLKFLMSSRFLSAKARTSAMTSVLMVSSSRTKVSSSPPDMIAARSVVRGCWGSVAQRYMSTNIDTGERELSGGGGRKLKGGPCAHARHGSSYPAPGQVSEGSLLASRLPGPGAILHLSNYRILLPTYTLRVVQQGVTSDGLATLTSNLDRGDIEKRHSRQSKSQNLRAGMRSSGEELE